MTPSEANELFMALGGKNNKRFWDLHIAEAYRCGKENIKLPNDIFTHCVEVAYAQYLAEQKPAALDDVEYLEIMQGQEIYDAL